MTPRRLPLLAPLLAALVVATVAVTPVAAVDYDFPVGQEAFHTYPEMAAEVAAAAADHPSIVQRFSIGRSYQGRELWAAKVSDNVATDEAEPEILVDGLHHGDEHMSLEMTLAVLRWLTDGYGTDTRITKIVDTREIWIVFALNPDGATFDVKARTYHDWRKNRQPNAGTTSVGTDLNRNYDYHWGCCGGSSGSPSSTRYRGASAFSAPESRALADFVRGRVVGGVQQIRAAVSFHTTGRLVMWPYGHTYTDIPWDMTVEDRAALASMGRIMAASNGYRPIQASALYLSSGTSRDWLYGRYRIFAYTFELSPDSTPYPSAAQIPNETGRNRNAVLYLFEQADCPYRSSGKANTRCGAFDDDFEASRGWVLNPLGTDTATSGRWARTNPAGTVSAGGAKQLNTTPSGSIAFVTGGAAGTSASANDLDGGRTTIQSRPIQLPTRTGQHLTFRYYLAHASNATSADELRVSLVADDGTATSVLLERAAANNDNASWATASILLDRWASTRVRIRIEATDAGAGSLIEAGIDDVRITRN